MHINPSQPPSLENPFVGTNKTGSGMIPEKSQPPSLENPFVGGRGNPCLWRRNCGSQPPSLENPFVGTLCPVRYRKRVLSLNLQAWRIPLWDF